MWDSNEARVWPTVAVSCQFQSESGFFLRLSISTIAYWPVPGVAIGGSF